MEIQDERLMRMGRRVHGRRIALDWTMSELSAKSGVSVRFLAQLEAGAANISVRRLWDVASALETAPAELLDDAMPQTRSLTLIGMRGAGKTAVGERLAERMGLPFIELDGLIESEAGLALGEVFALHGEAYYRRLEASALRSCLGRKERLVIATGGGIVDDAEIFEWLRRESFSIWLKAPPEIHMDRVRAQGDLRPMRNRANAMAELSALWDHRAPLYAQAHHAVDTMRLGLKGSVEAILELVALHDQG